MYGRLKPDHFVLRETLSLKRQDSEKNGLVALGHTTLIKEGTFQTLVLQTPGGVGWELVPPPDRPGAGNTGNKERIYFFTVRLHTPLRTGSGTDTLLL